MKLAMVALVGIFAVMLLAACGGGGDSIEARAEAYAERINDQDWKSVYEFCTPGYRDDNSFDESDVEELEEALREFASSEGGYPKFSVADAEVDSDGEGAKVTYNIEVAGSAFDVDEVDWVKEEGKWYVDCL